MKAFPKDIRFKYAWRTYQQRILDNLDTHLEDGHLHVVAPPGSGKTVLGLEVAIRLDKACLILAPTIAIRNQWIQRLCELFLGQTVAPDWISTDIRKPGFVTAVTYQGLHAACSGTVDTEQLEQEDAEQLPPASKPMKRARLGDISKALLAKKVQTLVLDEAHHLKNAWWETLSKLKSKLNPIVVGLTATPPYDVSAAEWKRYIEINGPVDEEISVPELVEAGDLCLHQDYVHISLPTIQECEQIDGFRSKASTLFHEIKEDEQLLAAVESHPYWIAPLSQIDAIYGDLPAYSACLIYMASQGRTLSEEHQDIIGEQDLAIPLLDYTWMQRLLHFYIFSGNPHFAPFEEHRLHLENRLRRSGVLEQRSIDFLNNRAVTGRLTSSVRKLDSIKEIVDFEYAHLGERLRMVVLADYIRKEFYSSGSTNNLDINRLGVLPIFEKLRRTNTMKAKLAVLTGSIILIPSQAKEAFIQKAASIGIEDIRFTSVPYDANYLRVEPHERLKHQVVHVVTQLFQAGYIEVLIGTKALLGEGWDAPAINALILASFVGSFVLSNQMRGRAIRTEKGNPHKTSNIWHLVCLDPGLPNGGADFLSMHRKFKAFVGVSFHDDGGIENGVGRLDMPFDNLDGDRVAEINAAMFASAADRAGLEQRWNDALKQGVAMVEELKIPFRERVNYVETKSLYLTKTVRNATATVASAAVGYAETLLNNYDRIANNIHNLRELSWALLSIAAGGVVLFGRRAYFALQLYSRYRDISKDIQHIAEALLTTLVEADLIHTDASQLSVDAHVDRSGAVYCHLNGGSTFEKSIFIKALQELVDPIDNPRYLITREHRTARGKKQLDYHAVPEVIGKNKENAQHFQKQWIKKVGSTTLLFTRSVDGRKALLQARLKSLSAQFADEVEHVSKWL
ncbi:DEAD/DEAH box helicase family protein [Sphingobacterium bambusae]|uniref:DEAD/DEAH box helicase family protein n=1 Tax=Sphingobacterium bambusae TaxID=662858 RepID=A0ABW6BL49_9SPHI|nr:DEAD/DEAH box helicase family protein [Sphingobacterium bambusae]WPL47962.1 DEAD/DEAH box helicase family protein [Sphingobacterium bambusae]